VTVPEIHRRSFIAAALAGVAFRPASATQQSHLMTLDLTPGAIGIEAGQRGVVELAARHGFDSVAPLGGELVAMPESELAALRELMDEKGLVWGAAGLPVDFRRDDAVFESSSQGLHDYARGLRRAGVARVGTWLMPCSDLQTYRRYFEAVAQRLRPTARVLADHGLSLGLEYVGPKTSWTRCRYPFVHTLAETAELIEAIGVPGVGFVLDSWHWFLAGDSVDQILALGASDVIAVDLNDAPLGIPNDEQRDGERELPAATGVIPTGEFLNALREIGYAGPVRAEPFNAPLNALEDDAAAAAAIAALRKAFSTLA
jgi:sugar phosphate isomerase/epimerase